MECAWHGHRFFEVVYETTAQAIGQLVAEVRQLDDESNRWTAVEMSCGRS
jgi:hypothetical protein